MYDGGDDLVKLRDGGIASRREGDEMMVLGTANHRYVAVNRSGAVLWPLLVAPVARHDLVATLLARFGIDEAKAAADVDTFISSLGGLGLLDPG
jgi:hypothetical protein